MNLQYTSEQKQLRESVERYVREEYDFQKRRSILQSGAGHDPEGWQQLAAMGWLAVPFDEAAGGIGGGPTDIGIVMEGIGRSLMLEPYLPNVVLAGGVIAALGTDAQQQELLGPLMAGSRKYALAYAEPQSRYELADCRVRAESDGEGYMLRGRKALVMGGASADTFVVLARTGGEPGERAGLTFFLVDAKAYGLGVTRYATNDGTMAADLLFEGVRVGAGDVIGEVGQAMDTLEAVIDAGIAAIASEAVGAMSVLVDTTLEYLKTRVQFGRPIGTNQALQHRMVDMYIALDEARSMALYGALMLSESDAAQRRKALSATKIEIDRAARLIGQESVQLHGAMGVTDELAVGHYFKRLTVIGLTFGDTDWHMRRYAKD